MADDELQEVRDNFYVGNFQKALLMAESTTASTDFAQSELGALLARCCLSGNVVERLKSKEMQNSEYPGQRATVFMMIMLKSRQDAQRNLAKERLLTLAKETQDMSCTLLAAIAHAMDGNWKDAAEMTKAHPTLEMQALCVMFCLSCNQAGMAEKLVAEMQGANDDSAVFRLANAAVKMAVGDPEEAYLTYCDLSAQFPPKEDEDSGMGSTLLQVGKALANMQRGMYSEALEDLQRAFAMSPTDPDVLVNLCCCMTHLGKKEEFQQYYAKLEQAAPTHPYVVKTQGMKNVFTKFKASLEA